jgi:hypothetical protein
VLHSYHDWFGNKNIHSTVSMVCAVRSHLCVGRGSDDAQSHTVSE